MPYYHLFFWKSPSFFIVIFVNVVLIDIDEEKYGKLFLNILMWMDGFMAKNQYIYF